MSSLTSWLTAKPYRTTALGLSALAALLLVALLWGSVFAGARDPSAGNSPSTTPATFARASASSSASPMPTPSPIPTPTPSPTPLPQLPALLGAIGDSYSQAFSVSPSYLYDHPQFSWVVGTASNDGVFSLAERFKSLGASPVVVDAATSGKKMDDAARQAGLVIAQAGKLAAGQTAYVTFALGTNDLCDTTVTDPITFEVEARTALQALEQGLPHGSRLLMLAVPDFVHLRAITQADQTAKAFLAAGKNPNRCPPFLGNGGAITLAQAESYLSQYDASLATVCAEVNATYARGGNLFCSWDPAHLALDDFKIGDMGTVDYFHPSLTGQAKIAAAAWAADVWSTLPAASPAAAVPSDVSGVALSLVVPAFTGPWLRLGTWPRRRRRVRCPEPGRSRLRRP